MALARRTVGVLDHVAQTVRNVELVFGNNSNSRSSITTINVQELPVHHRQPVAVARFLAQRLRRVGCRNCWLRPDHCICDRLSPVVVVPDAGVVVGDDEETVSTTTTAVAPPLPLFFFAKIFVLMHHNEVGLALDTAKIILAAFPETSRLVVGGIPSQFQQSMKEMEEAIADGTCVVLYPQDGAPRAKELFCTTANSTTTPTTIRPDVSKYPHLIVIDGTWEQARRLHSRYIPAATQHVQLNLTNNNNNDNVAGDVAGGGNGDGDNNNNKLDEEGRQLRPHPIPWREIATVHALQLLAEDMGLLTLPLREYQKLAKAAVRAQQLAPPPPPRAAIFTQESKRSRHGRS